MRLKHPPPSATRFFARPLSGILECPRCGQVLYFQSGTRKSTAGWDKTTGRLTCWSCKFKGVVGLIVWPAGKGLATAPRDHVPDERQLAQLRAMAELGGHGAGWWMPKDQAQPAKRPQHTNVTAACNCWSERDKAFIWQAGCPLHGDEGPAEELEEPDPEEERG